MSEPVSAGDSAAVWSLRLERDSVVEFRRARLWWLLAMLVGLTALGWLLALVRGWSLPSVLVVVVFSAMLLADLLARVRRVRPLRVDKDGVTVTHLRATRVPWAGALAASAVPNRGATPAMLQVLLARSWHEERQRRRQTPMRLLTALNPLSGPLPAVRVAYLDADLEAVAGWLDEVIRQRRLELPLPERLLLGPGDGESPIWRADSFESIPLEKVGLSEGSVQALQDWAARCAAITSRLGQDDELESQPEWPTLAEEGRSLATHLSYELAGRHTVAWHEDTR